MLFLFYLMIDINRTLSLDKSDPPNEVIHRLLIAVEFGHDCLSISERHDTRNGACDLLLQKCINLCGLNAGEAIKSPVLDLTNCVAHVLCGESKEDDSKRGVCCSEQGNISYEGVIDGVHMVEWWQGGRHREVAQDLCVQRLRGLVDEVLINNLHGLG